MNLKIAALSVTLLLAACAGTDFDFDQARRVQVGMTEQQVTDLMGRPYSVVSRGDSEMWIWTHANGLTGASRTVSFEMRGGKVATVPTIPASFKSSAAVGSMQMTTAPMRVPDAPLSKDEYKKVQVQKLTDQNLPYDEYQKQYKAIMAQ